MAENGAFRAMESVPKPKAGVLGESSALKYSEYADDGRWSAAVWSAGSLRLASGVAMPGLCAEKLYAPGIVGDCTDSISVADRK